MASRKSLPKKKALTRKEKAQRDLERSREEAERKVSLRPAVAARVAELEQFIAEQPTIYFQLSYIYYVSNEIMNNKELGRYLAEELFDPLLQMLYHLVIGRDY